jgi:hypothetical protein
LCFRFTSSWSISSDVVITRLLAWKPRSAVIMLVNSWARSTFDISTAPGIRVPRPFVPAMLAVSAPELFVAIQLLPETRWRPASFGKVAREMTAILVTTPAESVTDTVPFWATVTDCEPGGIVILVSLAAPVSGLPDESSLKPTT